MLCCVWRWEVVWVVAVEAVSAGGVIDVLNEVVVVVLGKGFSGSTDVEHGMPFTILIGPRFGIYALVSEVLMLFQSVMCLSWVSIDMGGAKVRSGSEHDGLAAKCCSRLERVNLKQMWQWWSALKSGSLMCVGSCGGGVVTCSWSIVACWLHGMTMKGSKSACNVIAVLLRLVVVDGVVWCCSSCCQTISAGMTNCSQVYMVVMVGCGRDLSAGVVDCSNARSSIQDGQMECLDVIVSAACTRGSVDVTSLRMKASLLRMTCIRRCGSPSRVYTSLLVMSSHLDGDV
eukprot:117821-Amphidinium_carterae.1